MMHDPYDQDDDADQLEGDDADQREPTDGVEVADAGAIQPEDDIRELVLEAFSEGLSGTKEAHIAVMSSFMGPVPPPSMMEDYNEIVPNGAERIMAMAESRLVMADKKLDMDKARQDAAIADRQEARRAERRGQNYSLIFLLGVLAVSIVGILAGQPILGSSVTILCLASVVYAFVRGRD